MRWFVLTLLASCLMVGCKTHQQVVVETRTDTLLITKQQRDSIWLHDSIHVKDKGDTLLIEKWHTKYIEKMVHDTIYRSRVDSIPVPVTVTEYVERELTWWQEAKMKMGVCMMLLMGGFVLYLIIKKA